MKELSIEEKAKAYDEAIERAKNFIENGDKRERTIAESIFAGIMEESEDERIRKELLGQLRKLLEMYDTLQTEKEYSKVQSWIAWLEKQGTPAKLSEEEQNRFAKGVLSSCAISFIDYLDAHKQEGKMCVSNGECEDIENAFHNAMWDRLHRYYCKYIEKQGEQKPVPKFKVGDTMRTLQEATNGYTDGMPVVVSIDEEYYHCNNELIAIKDQDDYEYPPMNRRQKPADLPKGEDYGIDSLYHAARILEKTLGEVDGYESDDGILEHKCAIEAVNRLYKQKPAWSEEDRQMKMKVLKYLSTRCNVFEYEEVECWLKSIKDRVLPKQEWSEQEQVRINRIVACLENLDVVDYDILLKDVDWLKSLRERYTWKPSDEQIKALANALSLAKNCGEESAFDIRTLYEQIKKLREE